jgi:hypothetical protein
LRAALGLCDDFRLLNASSCGNQTELPSRKVVEWASKHARPDPDRGLIDGLIFHWESRPAGKYSAGTASMHKKQKLAVTPQEYCIVTIRSNQCIVHTCGISMTPERAYLTYKHYKFQAL